MMLAAAACTVRETDNNEAQTIITAGIEGHKTVMAFPEIHWMKGDAICVNGQASTSSTIQNGGKTASFAFSGTIEAPYYAICPASAYSTNSFRPAKGNYGTAVIPSEQSYTRQGFDPSAAILVAFSDESDNPSSICFHCAVAFLKFTIAFDPAATVLKKIEIRANGREDMYGDFTFQPSTGTILNTKLLSKGISVKADDGITPNEEFYVVIPAKTYSAGLTIRIYDTDSHYMEMNSSKTFPASAGVAYPVNVTYVPNGTVVGTDIQGPVDFNCPVASIEQLNTHKESLNTHAGETGRSCIELDRRKRFILDESQLGHPVLEYPRIKKLPDGSYIMFYMPQRTGHSVYCSFSKDLENWDGAHTVWGKQATKDPEGNDDEIHYADGDMVIADNGDLLVFGTYRLKKGSHKYLQQWGLTMKRSHNMGKTWGEEQLLYKTCVWEPMPIKLPSGEILVFFTDSDHDWDPTITGISLVRSTDNGYTWTTQAPVMRYASGWAYPHRRSVDVDPPQGDSAIRWTSQMPAAVLLNDRQTCLMCYESHNPSEQLRLNLGWEDSSWATTLTGMMEGPSRITKYFSGGSGPYLAQFPSGETVLSYSGLNWYIRMGNETGSDLGKAPFFTPRPGTAHWGNLELDDDHTMLGTVALFYGTSTDAIYEQKRDIVVAKFRLNHRIDMPEQTPVLDGLNDDWADNTAAFFIGSDTLAQCCFRFCRDAENLYVLMDCLDGDESNPSDRIDLYFSDGSTTGSICSYGISTSGNKPVITNGKGAIASKTWPGYGYIIEMKIPLSDLPYSASDGIFFNASLTKGDITDTFNFRTLESTTNWLQVKPQ